MTKEILTFEHVDFYYDRTPILEDVSFGIKEGEFVGVFGPNGGGKTTLLRLILGFLRPNRGTVRLHGVAPGKIGYVPQAVRFDKAFPISVLDVVLMGCLSSLTWWGGFSKETKEKGRKALEKVGLLHKEKATFGTLSGGEAQRVLIARSIIQEPSLLILDEPTASVDQKAEQAIFELLLKLKGSMTILMVTHDLQTIVDKAERLLCVQRRVSSLHAKEVCEHFALGLYHTPLTSTQHFSL